MCTMTWCRWEDGYDALFTRDERRTRQPAVPPSIEVRRGVRYLAPTDRDAGGTWILVNEHGLTWGVANYYARPMDIRPPAPRSRGRLVRDLADVVRLEDAPARLAGEPLTDYNPCVLVGVGPDGEAVRWIWDGDRLRSDPVTTDDLPITTNPFNQHTAECRRREALRDWMVAAGGLGPAALRGFHGDHRGPEGAFDVCMSTDVARSVSLSHIEVRGDRVAFRYHPIDEDRRVVESAVRLSLPRGP